MTTTTIYDPCTVCAGRGSVQYVGPTDTDATELGLFSGAWVACTGCGGSGKGRVREIREVRGPSVYPDVWPADPIAPNTCGGLPGSVVK